MGTEGSLDDLIAAAGLLLLFGIPLAFGLLTGRMIGFGIPLTQKAYRDENDRKFWFLATYNTLGASAGLYVLIDTLTRR